MSELANEEVRICRQWLSMFQINGQPADQAVTQGQLEIFAALIFRTTDRLQIITSTQYGKSLMVALACIVISCIEEEIIAVVAPRNEQAKIIMRYYIDHLGDHPAFYEQLEKNTKLERLRMEENKERIILRNRGGIYVLSAQASNSIKGFQSAMGAGARIVIQDESALIPDPIEATLFRMIAGYKEAFYCKIGNPFYRNHFYQSWVNPEYDKIFIDFKRGLAEGRYLPKFIDEARLKPFFGVLFECKFPDEDAMDTEGYIRLITDLEYENALTDKAISSRFKVLGVDPGDGGDPSTICKRSQLTQTLMFNQKLKDQMALVNLIVKIINRDEDIRAVVIDKTGVGSGVFSRLNELKRLEQWLVEIIGIDFGAKSEDELFLNKKAELYWLERKWLLTGGKLVANPAWQQFRYIKYKESVSKKLQIQSKDELRRLGLASPNAVDAAVLTQAVRIETLKKKQVIRTAGRRGQDPTQEFWHE